MEWASEPRSGERSKTPNETCRMRGGDGTSEGCLGCAERDRNEVEMTSQPLMLFCFLHRKMSHLFRKCLYVLCAWRFGSAKYSCQTMTVPIFPQNKSDKMSKTVAYIVPYLRNCSEFLTSWVCGSRKLKYDGSGRFLCTAINIDRRIWGIPGCLCVGEFDPQDADREIKKYAFFSY